MGWGVGLIIPCQPYHRGGHVTSISSSGLCGWPLPYSLSHSHICLLYICQCFCLSVSTICIASEGPDPGPGPDHLINHT